MNKHVSFFKGENMRPNVRDLSLKSDRVEIDSVLKGHEKKDNLPFRLSQFWRDPRN